MQNESFECQEIGGEMNAERVSEKNGVRDWNGKEREENEQKWFDEFCFVQTQNYKHKKRVLKL